MIEIECCPFRSPSRACNRLPGGFRRSSSFVARSTYSSFRAALATISGGKRLALPVSYGSFVRRSAKDLITPDSVTRHVTNVNIGMAWTVPSNARAEPCLTATDWSDSERREPSSAAQPVVSQMADRTLIPPTLATNPSAPDGAPLSVSGSMVQVHDEPLRHVKAIR